MRTMFLFRALLVMCLAPGWTLLHAWQGSPQAEVFILDHGTNFVARPDGVDIEDGSTREEITALRDDVIRIRIGRNDKMPEDASWAVLPQARHSRINVTPESSAASFGFRTKSMQVQIARSNLLLTDCATGRSAGSF
jgi:alpha-glucosidase